MDSAFLREPSRKERAATAKQARTAAAAKVALLVGYESGFPQTDGGVKKDAEELAQGVASAEHIPVAADKAAAGKAAVLLLLDGETVQSIKRGGLVYVPVKVTDGPAADAFEVVMEAPTLLYRTNAEAKARRQHQIVEAEKRIADAHATLIELQEALGHSEAAFAKTADSPDAHAELSDIGAMALEQHRIKKEIKSQQTAREKHQRPLWGLKNMSDDDLELVEHRLTPRFTLRSGSNRIPADPDDSAEDEKKDEQVVHVVRKSQPRNAQKVQFRHAVASSK